MLVTIAVGALKFYQQYVSPLFGPACRFSPSCSAYSAQAFARYGITKGTSLTLRRLLKCHPYHPGGFDPVP